MSAVKPLFATEDKGLLTKLAESVGLTAKDIGKTLDIPTVGDILRTGEGAVKTVHDDIMLVYRDAEQNVSSIGGEIANTKDQLITTFQFAVVLFFIIFGGSIILYGPEMIAPFQAVYERIMKYGVSFNFSL